MKRRGQDPGWRQQAAEWLDQVLALPMLVLTVVFLAVLVLPVIYPDVPAGSRSALEAIDLGIWTVFLAEYLARLFVAPDRLAFVRRSGEPRDYVRPGNEPRDHRRPCLVPRPVTLALFGDCLGIRGDSGRRGRGRT